MGVGEGDDRDGREKRWKERQGWEREIERERGEREGVTGEKEKKLQT